MMDKELMIHENERLAFERGAALMRETCARRIQEAAEASERVGKECRQETHKELLLIEAKTLCQMAAALHSLPLPDF